MAQISTVKLSRYDATPWGFRLQGGKDFGTPLVIQKVNGGSLAEKAGLVVGDALLKVNNTDVSDLKHKDAQDVIVRSGNAFDITIQRGGIVTSTWKPSVSPVGKMPTPASYLKSTTPAVVTKTSLAHKGPSLPLIGSSHNVSPHPFVGAATGGPDMKLVNKQYNSPVGIYSEESIAETLSAQAEVLAGGVLGVNFKKNEKNYTPANSAVLKMVQEADQEPRSPEPDDNKFSYPFGNNVSHHSLTAVQPQSVSAPPPSGMRHVQAPTTSPNASLPPGQNICADCERLIVGVFVRIKEKNLHVECFKCATCGSSLKNVGYYNINNKLYCDVHAKMIARKNPPGPNLEPVTVPFGTKPPANTISAALTSHVPKGPSTPTYQQSTTPTYQPPKTPTTPTYQSPKPIGTPSYPSPPTFPPYSSSPVSSGPKPFGMEQSTITPKTGAYKPIYNPTKPTMGKPINSFKGGNGGGKGSSSGLTTAPRRGRGVLNPQNLTPGARVPLCGQCFQQIRGPFITALGKIWCPDHFVCVRPECKRPLQDIGFVEDPNGLHCEYCFEKHLAPFCNKCSNKVKGDCLNAIGKHFHPECFLCAYCGKLFGNNPFFLEEGLPYCENDWNELFTTKCFACGFPIEAGDRWVEALNNNYHSLCFNCSVPSCKKNLEGQSFFAKAGRPFCKTHAR